jgi:hypothetical protein
MPPLRRAVRVLRGMPCFFSAARMEIFEGPRRSHRASAIPASNADSIIVDLSSLVRVEVDGMRRGTGKFVARYMGG